MDRKLRVCQVITRFVVGGAETVALDLCRKLDPERFDVTLVAALEPLTGGDPIMRKRFEEAGVRILTPNLQTYKNPRELLRYWRLLRRERFDIVHGHNRFSDAWAVRVSRWAGIRHRFWTRHLVYQDMTPAQIARYRRLSRHVHMVIAVSNTVRQACIDIEGIAPDKVVTVVNGIDTKRFAPISPEQRTAMRSSLGVENHELLMLFVGRMDPQKAPDDFVRLVWRLREDGLPVKGFMCGRGSLDDTLRSMIASGPEGVAVLGVRSDIPALLGAADLFVSTSRNEGLPLNVMEAMSSGAAFLAPAIGQVEELVAGSGLLRSCLLSPPPVGELPIAQLDAWAATTRRYLEDSELRRRCGIEARRVLEQSYSLEQMVRQYEDLYLRFAHDA